MLLVDTLVWIDHFRKGDNALAEALENDAIIIHPHVLGELALSNLKDRSAVLSLLRNLPEAVVATDDEVQSMIVEQSLFGRDIGYIDAHLLAAVQLAPEARLWTRDKRLSALAVNLQLEYSWPGRHTRGSSVAQLCRSRLETRNEVNGA